MHPLFMIVLNKDGVVMKHSKKLLRTVDQFSLLESHTF